MASVSLYWSFRVIIFIIWINNTPRSTACPSSDYWCTTSESSDGYGVRTIETISECQACVENTGLSCGWLILNDNNAVCTTANTNTPPAPCNITGFSGLGYQSFIVDPDYCPANTKAAEVGVGLLAFCLVIAVIILIYVVRRYVGHRLDADQGDLLEPEMANECAEVEFYTRTSLYTRNTRPSVDVGAANATPSQTNNFGQFAIHYQYDRGFRHMIVALSMSLVLIGPVLLAVLLQGEHFGMQTSMLRLNLTMLVVAVLASFLLLVAACSTGQDLIIAFDAQSGIRRYLRIGICCRGKFYRDRNFHQVSLQDVTNVYLHEWSYSATDSDGGWYTVNKIRIEMSLRNGQMLYLDQDTSSSQARYVTDQLQKMCEFARQSTVKAKDCAGVLSVIMEEDTMVDAERPRTSNVNSSIDIVARSGVGVIPIESRQDARAHSDSIAIELTSQPVPATTTLHDVSVSGTT